MSSVHNFSATIEYGVREQNSSDTVEYHVDEIEDNDSDDDGENYISCGSVERNSISVTNHEKAPSSEGLLKSSALFLLGLKEKYKLTQASVQGIVDGVASLMQQNINYLQTQVSTKCRLCYS